MLEELKSQLQAKAAQAADEAMALASEGRGDEAALRRIRENIFGVFVSVIEASANPRAGADPVAFFASRLETIPASWRAAHASAQERGDEIRLAQEGAKLSALDEVEEAFRELCGDAR